MNHNEWELPPSQGSGGLDDWAIPAQPQPGAQFGAQFGAQPAQAAQSASGGGNGGGKRKLLMALAAAVVLALVGGVTVYFATGGKSIAAMSYVSLDEPGPNPFMQSTSNDSVGKKIASGESKTAGASGPVAGSEGNLYGGTGELTVCDAQALTANLNQNADLNAAFAAGIGINASDVESFIASLKSVVLLQDTWVTNHGYDNGKPTPFQAVLQKGTAVMVDSWGVPRVRCACGNPLAEAWNGYTAPSATDAAWDGYKSEAVATVYGSDEQSEMLTLTEVEGTVNILLFNEEERKTQKSAVNSVTADTPRTMPKDMGVKPDKELLDELGIPVAKYDEKQRPTGGERFNEKVDASESDDETGAVGTNFPDWKSQTTMVDAGQFLMATSESEGQYLIEMKNKDVTCEVRTKGGSDRIEFVMCRDNRYPGNAFDFKGMEVSHEISSIGYSLNSVSWYTSDSRFKKTKSFHPDVNSGGEPISEEYRTVKSELGVGHAVQFGQLVCFNLAEEIGCELPDTKYFSNASGELFFEGSEEAYGTTCGQVTNAIGSEIDVLIGPGGVDCKTAMDVGDKYISAPRDPNKFGADNAQSIDGWACSFGTQDAYGSIGRLGTCINESEPTRMIVVQ